MGKSNRFDDGEDFEFVSRNRDRQRAAARKHKELERSSVFSVEKEEISLDFHGTGRNRDWNFRA